MDLTPSALPEIAYAILEGIAESIEERKAIKEADLPEDSGHSGHSGQQHEGNGDIPPTGRDWDFVPPVNPSPQQSWFDGALLDEEAEVSTTQPGGRRNRLRDAAYNLGGQIHHGYLDEATVTRRLTAAGLACGLEPGRIAETIRDGLADGKANPLPWPDKLAKPSSNGNSVECVVSVVDIEPEIIPPLRLGTLPPSGVFPIEVLPRPCVTLATSIAKAVGCDVASLGGAMLAIAGGVIGRTVHLKLKDNWIVAPIIFHANVGEAGQGKSWGQKYLTDGHLEEIERGRRANFASEKQDYLAKCRADKIAIHVKPVPRQLLIDDSTVEALFVALANNPRGLLVTLDELSVLFAGLNQYKGGKGADRSHFLKLWTGSRVSINRVRNEFGEPLYIPFPHLGITGNIPPVNLPMIAGPMGNDGMAERWVYTFPGWHKKLKASERGTVRDSEIAGWDDIIRRL